jgi:hypothetical protein
VHFNPHHRPTLDLLGELGFLWHYCRDGVLAEDEVRAVGYTPEAIAVFAQGTYAQKPEDDVFIDGEEAERGLESLAKLRQHIKGTLVIDTWQELTSGCWRGRVDVLHLLVLANHVSPFRNTTRDFMSTCDYNPNLPVNRHQFFRLEQTPDKFNEVAQHTARLENPHNLRTAVGTGVIVQYKGHRLLITVNHNLEQWAGLRQYRLSSGEVISFSPQDILAQDYKNDFAVLRVSDQVPTRLPGLAVDLTYDPAHDKGDVFISGYSTLGAFGYPTGLAEEDADLLIATCDDVQIEGTKIAWGICEGRKGMSGGPWVNSAQKVFALSTSVQWAVSTTISAFGTYLGSEAALAALDPAVTKLETQ